MKLAVLDDYHDYARRFADFGPDCDVTVFRDPIAPEALAETLAPFDALCVMRERTPLPASLIEALPNLRLIVTTGMRNLSIDSAAAKARGITLCGTASRTPATTQLAMTLILMATRNILPNLAAVNAGGWQADAGRDLDGLTLGLIGLGRLGALMAQMARPFGMKIIAWSENLTPERCAEVGVRHAESLDALLSQADVASIHLVLSERTRGLIGAAELAAMKPDAVLVNTSRGPIVDEAAIVPALRAGTPGCVALDVFDTEPLPADHVLRDSALIEAGRLILSPHIGYGALQTFQIMYEEAGEDVRAYLAGDPVRVI
ncbi:Glycerate dehydrogenase [Roseivivax sp. THAF40]|uniref:D-2-hydroxyacid dehydrogenase family protein n=1 Tax=unclassified Roseivivax TaxID=2639302 RepID=UPI0012689D6B|nr:MULTISPECIES: D-2-hydroxyacid dehydrogenase family protein [unclassified Roseivivax]QFS82739.1 Glycerate dehydrogenase [Roseivivax sp. THAF197b]QFT46508.1 Glycerate dehydrogenase [Roseivivax sp. THAF40]